MKKKGVGGPGAGPSKAGPSKAGPSKAGGGKGGSKPPNLLTSKAAFEHALGREGALKIAEMQKNAFRILERTCETCQRELGHESKFQYAAVCVLGKQNRPVKTYMYVVPYEDLHHHKEIAVAVKGKDEEGDKVCVYFFHNFPPPPTFSMLGPLLGGSPRRRIV